MPITSEELLVEDADTPADEIVYSLLQTPTNGDIIVGGVGVTSFTQQLINDNRVMFAHRGALACWSFLMDLLIFVTNSIKWRNGGLGSWGVRFLLATCPYGHP